MSGLRFKICKVCEERTPHSIVKSLKGRGSMAQCVACETLRKK